MEGPSGAEENGLYCVGSKEPSTGFQQGNDTTSSVLLVFVFSALNQVHGTSQVVKDAFAQGSESGF